MALRPGKARPLKSWGVYDLEWHPDTLRVLLCGVRDESGYRAYRSVAEFLEAELVPEYDGRWLFGHAGGLFDITFLISWILKNTDWRVEAGYSGSSAVSLTVFKDGCEYHFGDSYWLLKAPLDELGRMMGKRKSNEGNTARFVRECAAGGEAGWKRLRDYNADDNEILYLSLAYLENTLRDLGGELRVTLASCALALFRSSYLTKTIRASRNNNRFAREAYASAIVQNYANECEIANYYDINSSFPWSMLQPCAGELVRAGRSWTGSPLAIIEATVTVPDCYLPGLPFRHDGRIFFPTGQWRGSFTGIDLIEAQKRCVRIERIHRALEFAPWDDLAAYVTDIYERRMAAKKRGDPVMTYVLKLLLNSLYGKLAESRLKEQTLIRPLKPPKGARFVRPNVWAVPTIRDVPHEHVTASAFITARSRWRLVEFDEMALDRGGELFYNDCDSLITTADLSDQCGDDIGALKHEATIKGGIFLASKLYSYQKLGPAEDQRHVRAKGFSRCTWEQFLVLAMGEEVPVEIFTRLRSMLAKEEAEPLLLKGSKRNVGKMRPKRAMIDSNSRPWSVTEVRSDWNPPLLQVTGGELP